MEVKLDGVSLPDLRDVPPDVLLAAVSVLQRYETYADRSLAGLLNIPTKAHREAVSGNIAYWEHVRAGLKWAANCTLQAYQAGVKRGKGHAGKRVPEGRKASGQRRVKAG